MKNKNYIVQELECFYGYLSILVMMPWTLFKKAVKFLIKQMKAIFLFIKIIKYIIKNRGRKLKIRINLNLSGGFEIKGYLDSNYAGDRDTRQSVSGFSIFFNGAMVAWRSWAQRSVSLSLTEAEFIALSEAISEILFIWNVIIFIGGIINLPIQVHVDNMGALYLAENNSSNSRIRHIEARNLFIQEFIWDGVIKVVFVCSENNNADILTKMWVLYFMLEDKMQGYLL